MTARKKEFKLDTGTSKIALETYQPGIFTPKRSTRLKFLKCLLSKASQQKKIWRPHSHSANTCSQ